ncbi:MAG: DUF3990 domain-containing protein [Prevotella sp.]|nr:DUF3990 domain-containing protein [Prevotella sp.]
MILYHGSNVAIEEIDLSLCKPYKDFGKGFYLTDIKSQADEMAFRRVRLSGYGNPIVTQYEFDESLLNDNTIKILLFPKVSVEWAQFVLDNRDLNHNGFSHSYDIVVGPVADDTVAFQLRRYLLGGISLEKLVSELEYKGLNRQYFFGTELAISKLKKL